MPSPLFNNRFRSPHLVSSRPVNLRRRYRRRLRGGGGGAAARAAEQVRVDGARIGARAGNRQAGCQRTGGGCSRAPTRHAEPPRISKHGTPRLIRRQPSAVTILSKWYYRQICSVKTMLEVFFVHIVLSKCLFARNEREGTRENNYKRGKRPRRATLFINTRAQNLLKDLHSILLLSSLIFSCLASLIISS
jgi:hypothetical protein